LISTGTNSWPINIGMHAFHDVPINFSDSIYKKLQKQFCNFTVIFVFSTSNLIKKTNFISVTWFFEKFVVLCYKYGQQFSVEKFDKFRGSPRKYRWNFAAHHGYTGEILRLD